MSATVATPEPEDAPDGAPEKNPSALSAEAQGSNVPLGWKPTPSEPVPVVRCIQIKRDGNRCGRWSLRGGVKCYKHGGNGGALKNVEEHRAAIIEAAKLRLLDDTEVALDTLEALMEPGTSEAIRLKASTEVLDRAGVRSGFEIDVKVEEGENPAEEIGRRLADLKKSAEVARKIREAPSDDIVDAEVVEEDDQPTLFELDTEQESSDD